MPRLRNDAIRGAAAAARVVLVHREHVDAHHHRDRSQLNVLRGSRRHSRSGSRSRGRSVGGGSEGGEDDGEERIHYLEVCREGVGEGVVGRERGLEGVCERGRASGGS